MFKLLWNSSVFASLLASVLIPAYDRIADTPPKESLKATAAGVTLDKDKDVTAPVGKKCIVEAKTTAKKVTWKVPPELDWMPLTPTSIGIWGVPGVYTVAAMVPNGDDVLSVEISVTITGDVPKPVPNAFITELKAAYAKDSGTNKAVLLGKLAALYRHTGTVTVKDESIKTFYDLHLDFAGANAAQMGQTDLQNVRIAIQKRLDANLPTIKTAPIDRTLAGSEYLAVAAALEAVSK